MAIIEQEFLALTAALDVETFWQENAVCEAFTTQKPRCAVSFAPDDHWIFEFMNVSSTLRYYQDKTYRDALHREVNQMTRQYVGKAFFDEDTFQYSPKRIENLFGCEFDYHEGGTPWFVPVTDDPAEFAKILDRAETTDLCVWSLPEPFLKEWEERKRAGKSLPALGTGSRGPATIMTSVLKPETLFLWMYDYPDLMARFRDVLAAKMIELNAILREFSGNATPGWWITDDNCALFNRKLYQQYCVPVLETVLNAMAPGEARRYQHSDSAMGHLLDFQYALGIRSVNYGPTVDAALIREKMPDAIINGQLPPFLLRNGSPGEIRQRIVDDFQKAGQTGGLIVTTAGSLAAGTGVGRMRWMMQVVQQECRY
ncbi:uroporphyrinogen-III decarboxylase-like protein [Candidatus Moduliflexus flocculans]|uniref:Uroporphyrinogen-III decarboxylase-like protein n=1 Tax=Candidatus Moduliflexus flocculans TaxID=1499966 RepID=A0A081BP88_9BACT|nr:uroporphyrinogen-III decarboxylase-like protein [Candidatus Moduliflexus flocculans]